MKASFTRRLRSLARFSAATAGSPSAAARATLSGRPSWPSVAIRLGNHVLFLLRHYIYL